MTTSIPQFIGPYKFLKVTINKTSITGVNSIVEYEIPPASMNSNNVWVSTTANDFDDPELKEIINSYCTKEWNSTIIDSFKTQYLKTYTPIVPQTDSPATLVQLNSSLDILMSNT
jgi:hypothetical protein